MSLITKAGSSTRARKRAGTTKNPVRMPRGIATHAPKATSEACAASSVLKATTSVQSPGTVARAMVNAGHTHPDPSGEHRPRRHGLTKLRHHDDDPFSSVFGNLVAELGALHGVEPHGRLVEGGQLR